MEGSQKLGFVEKGRGILKAPKIIYLIYECSLKFSTIYPTDNHSLLQTMYLQLATMRVATVICLAASKRPGTEAEAVAATAIVEVEVVVVVVVVVLVVVVFKLVMVYLVA